MILNREKLDSPLHVQSRVSAIVREKTCKNPAINGNMTVFAPAKLIPLILEYLEFGVNLELIG